MPRSENRRWFMTLFLTDVWERFGFYGMQEILVLYATAPVARGGLGLHRATAAALFGVYLGVMFTCALAIAAGLSLWLHRVGLVHALGAGRPRHRHDPMVRGTV